MSIRELKPGDVAVMPFDRYLVYSTGKSGEKEEGTRNIELEVLPTLSRTGVVIKKNRRTYLVEGSPSDQVNGLKELFKEEYKGQVTPHYDRVKDCITTLSKAMEWDTEELLKFV